MIDIEKQNKIFFGKIAKYYDIFFGNWIRKIQIKVIKSTKIKKGSKVLDAGCGTGNLLFLLEKNDVELYGIDVSKEMLKIAKYKLKNTKLELSPAENLNFKNNFFDYVFSIDAFHHYFDKEKAMKNFHRVLKRNGKLIIVDVNFGSHLNKVFQKLEPGNNKIYNKNEMRKIFKQYSFKEIKQSKAGMLTVMTVGIK